MAMRSWTWLWAAVLVAVAAPARGADRLVSVEVELLGPKDKSLGKADTLVAPRATERLKATFGALTLVLDAEVGPTFDKDCNLITVTGRLEEAVPEGKPKKRELKRTTVHACGPSTQATIPGSGINRLVVTVRPAP